MHKLAPCPRCGSKSEVRLQTPVIGGMVNEAFFRCFACDLRSPNFPDWEPVAYPSHGERPMEPLRAFWNEWAKTWKPKPEWADTVAWEPIPDTGHLSGDPERVEACANVVLNGREMMAFRLANGSYEVEDVPEYDPNDPACHVKPETVEKTLAAIRAMREARSK